MKWYPINPDSDKPMLPPLEDYESGLSVDVLVFGYFNNIVHQPFFGIGYYQSHREGAWHVNTSNGAFDVPNDEDVTLLMWASLPDEPAEIPPPESVKNNDRSQDFAPHHNAVKSPDPMTSPYTPRPLGEIEH